MRVHAARGLAPLHSQAPTSNGVTMMSASVTPAEKPAAMRRTSDSFPSCGHV